MRHRAPFALPLLALCGLFACAQADAAVSLMRVGAGAGCDYRTDVLPDALQSAVDAVPTSIPAGDAYVIRVARNGNYVGKNVRVFDRSVTIEGGFDTCASASPGTANTEIDGTGAVTGPQVYIDGGNEQRREVALRGLTVKNSNGSGLFVRSANLRLDDVIITGNTATSGAGIRITGEWPGATLRMYGGSSLTNNTATTGGGGIHCSNQATLDLASDTAVIGNTAAGSGGGIYIHGCDATINSGGAGFAGLFLNISNNQAATGGGIAVSSSGTSVASNVVIGAGLSGSGPRPLIVNNTASGAGGGILALGQHVQVSLYDAIVAGNSVTAPAGYGGGVVATEGANVGVARTHARCAVEHCSRISGNSAAWGAAVAAIDGADVTVSGTRIEGNTAAQGGSAYLARRQNARLRSANNVIVGNTGASVVEISPASATAPRAASVLFLGDTLADNVDAVQVVAAHAEGQVAFGRSIVNASAAVPVATCSACVTQVTMHCNVFHSETNVAHRDGITSINANPGFVNAAAGNYRLHSAAWAIDWCPENTGFLPFDHEFSPRPVNSPLPDVSGPYDVGAYEWNANLFQDGFEDR